MWRPEQGKRCVQRDVSKMAVLWSGDLRKCQLLGPHGSVDSGTPQLSLLSPDGSSPNVVDQTPGKSVEKYADKRVSEVEGRNSKEIKLRGRNFRRMSSDMKCHDSLAMGRYGVLG